MTTTRRAVGTILAVVGLVAVLGGVVLAGRQTSPPDYGVVFSGERAYEDVLTQMSFGPRFIGSEGHALTVEWLVETLSALGWETEVQELVSGGQLVRNVIAKRGDGEDWVVLGAHYDTRMVADEDLDPALRGEPVPGANDGASGVAVLLELARVLPDDLEKEVWLVFFDAEDNGRIEGWDWILGSRAFVDALIEKPDAAVIVDMVGDSDLQLYYEGNSDDALRQEIWETAAGLGYGQFILLEKYHMLDDHTPFLQAGIPAVDIIDFDYRYWHTTADTADKVSAASLEAVGATVLAWLTGEE
ncbi:MAG: M28 family peptidase [Anaerolineae bacterium]|nr:MAG: M28 family peptidase [Anaerolineae bacterium]